MFAGRRGENNMRSRIAREGVRAGRGSHLPQQWPASLRAARTFAANVRSMCCERARVNGDDFAVAVFRTNDGFSWVTSVSFLASRVSWVPLSLGRLCDRRVPSRPRRAREFEEDFEFEDDRLPPSEHHFPGAYERIHRTWEKYVATSADISWNHINAEPVSFSVFINASWPFAFERNSENHRNHPLFIFPLFAVRILLHLTNLFNQAAIEFLVKAESDTIRWVFKFRRYMCRGLWRCVRDNSKATIEVQ